MKSLNHSIVSVSPLVNLNAVFSALAKATDTIVKDVKADWYEDVKNSYLKTVDGGIDDNGTAHINIVGELFETSCSCAYWFGIAIPSVIVQFVRNYERNNACKDIAFHFNTGGGSIGTIPELADAIFYCTKPTTAYITEQCCSAGYWLASQCKRIYATRGATIGALGVYIALTDYSEYEAQQGIKTHLISTAELKGIGEWGTPLTEAQKDFLQSFINRSGEMFVADIKRARPAFDVELFTGAFWHAEDALDRGLIDDVLI